MRWNRQAIELVLAAVPQVKLAGVNPQGSEKTTEQLCYQVVGAQDRLFVTGFVTEGSLLQADNVDVEMIELNSEYSDGGESSEPSNIVARALMTAALVTAGYAPVVRDLRAYF